MSKKQWYARSSYVLVAVVLVLSLGLLLAPAVSADPGEIHVDPGGGMDYTTITAALANANDGDEIIVHPGTYNGLETFPLVVNDDNLVIRSTGGAAVTIIDAEGAQVNILEIKNRDNVDVDGFTLRDATCCHFWANGKGILMTNSINCDISNMVIHDIDEGCGCDSAEPMGIFADDDCDNNTFTSIEIYDITSPNTARGIYLRRGSDSNTFSRINIHDLSVTDNVAFGIHVNGKGSGCQFNEFHDITIERIGGGSWAEGIELQDGSDNNTFGDLFIKDVTADDHAYGIKLGDSSDNMFDTGSEICFIEATCGCGIGIGVEKDPNPSNGNTFESFDIHDTCYGFYIDKSSDNLITKCNIHDNEEGVHLCSEVNQCVGNKINCNNIYRNTDYGVWKENTPAVDATANWWGDAHGPSHSPGNGDKISEENVLYDPYLSFQFQYCHQCGGVIPQPSAVPTANHWGIAAMIAVFGGLLVWRVRRRQLTS